MTAMTALERRRVERWVAAVALIVAAEEHASIDVPELNALGHMAAHAACEALLGLAVGVLQARPHPPGTVVKRGSREPGFPELLDEAKAAADPPFDPQVLQDLRVMHSARNGFVHGGQAIDHAELERAIAAAHMLSERVPMPGSRPVVGVASAVADIIEVEAVGLWLRRYDEQRAAGGRLAACDALAYALDATLDRTVPRLRHDSSRELQSPGQVSRELQRLAASGVFDTDRKAMAKAIDSLNDWLFPLAIGTPPQQLAFVRSVVGRVGREDRGGYPSSVYAATIEGPSEADLRRAAGIVVRIVLRLFAIGSLAARQRDAEIVELWKGAIATGKLVTVRPKGD
ncbi:MAG: hypothetical protein AB1627_15340 [Chloroflexota bacterium]